MSKRQLVNWLQNLILTLLTISALFLLTRLFLFHGGLSAQVQATFSPPSSPSHPAGDGYNSGLPFSSVHIMVTGDSAYGRYGQMYATASDPLLQQIIPLFREALGSASEVGSTVDKTLRDALQTPGIYLDLTCCLPLAAVSVWLGEDAFFDRSVRAMALTTELEDAATLYLLNNDGSIFRYFTALPTSAVQTLCEDSAPNEGSFAYESGYGGLPPYTVLVGEAPVLEDVQAGLPSQYSAHNLLTALDFNAYTTSRYTETSSGVEVVEESPRTLRIGPDGRVEYFGGSEVSSSLYRVSAPDGKPSDVLQGVCRLADALTTGTGAARLYLQALETDEEGYCVRFQYQTDGIPVFFADEGDALAVHVNGGVITAFQYRCRSYGLPSKEDERGGGPLPLLPPSMAAAIASNGSGTGLSIGYVDAGSGRLSAQWLAK